MKYFKISKNHIVALATAAVVIIGLVLARTMIADAATSPTLGAVGSYSVLGHTTVTNTGATTMPGDLGVSIGGAPVGFPPGTVGPPGSIRNAGDSLAAQNANTAAFGYIDQGCDTTYAGVKDLVAENLVAGVYCADAFELSGTLTLNGTGVWIFKSASTLTTSGTANVVGGEACNIWWRQVSSAVLGTNTALKGNVLSSTSISMQTGADLEGRALAQTGAVTLDNNTITGSACLGAPIFTSSSEDDSGATPGLPSTGVSPETTRDNRLKVIVPTGMLAALVIFYIVRKKRAS